MRSMRHSLVILTLLTAFIACLSLASPLVSADLDDGVLFYHNLDSNSYNDNTTNNVDGTVNGATYNSGRETFIFNGISDYVTFGDVNSLDGWTNRSFMIVFNRTAACGASPNHDVLMAKQSVFYVYCIDGDEINFEVHGFGNTRYTGGVTINELTQLVYVVDGTNDRILLYKNGVLVQNLSYNPTVPSNSNAFIIGVQAVGGSSWLAGEIYATGAWNRTLTSSEVANLYNSGSFVYYPFPTAASNVTVTATNVYNSSGINNFSVNIDGNDYYTTDGTITLPILSNDTSLYNINFYNATGYFNQTSLNYNFSASGNLQFETYQAIVKVGALSKISNFTLSTFGVVGGTASNSSVVSNSTTLFTNAGNLEFYLDGTSGWYSDSESFEIIGLTTNNIELTGYNHNLTVQAEDLTTSNSIDSFEISVKSQDYPGWVGDVLTTSSGEVVFNLISGNYSLEFISGDYELLFKNISLNTDDLVTFKAKPTPSINITFYDEQTGGSLEGVNVTVDSLINGFQMSNTTSGGGLFLKFPSVGVGEFKVSSGDYDSRLYFVTLTSFESPSLKAYLLNTSESETFLFYVRDQQMELLEGVLISFQRFINSSYVTVAQCKTDVSGTCSVGLVSGDSYQLIIEAVSYTTRTLSLKPDLSVSPYTINLQPVSGVSFVGVSGLFSYSYKPVINILNTNYERFNLTVSSPDGLIEWFGVQSFYNDSSYLMNVSGSPSGGTANIVLPLVENSTVNVRYFVKVSGFNEFTFNKTYYVGVVLTPGNFSLMGLSQAYTSTFSPLFKVLLSVGVILFSILMVSPFIPTHFLGFLAVAGLLIFTVIGWIPFFIGVVSMITGAAFLVVVGRGGG